MVEIDEDPQMGFESEEDDDELSDGELQEAFAKGLLKPGLNVPLLEPKKAINNVEGLRKCLAEFKRNLPWAERLDLTNYPAVDIVAKAEGRAQQPEGSEDVSAEDDFQREMYFYRQAQATVLAALPKLHKFKIPTKRPEDYFAEMAKTDQHMQKVRKSHDACSYFYSHSHVMFFSPNSKKKYKDKKFGFGGKKKGSKWNTKDSHDDVSGFKARMAHGKGGKQFGKGGKTNKRPGKETRKKMKARK
ncbi:probable rRNA-processing protein EBP2 [Sinocyclocheilus grahami]|uniref:probable rRNA-processing protein EBP2 n=1 Tax=Sinocyclocheilus grahami TaxID=75366 RepID=UPI0007AD4403|nr:PREDICTED: probable rRNA-processing protein EBP2 [Sinocyclocheilus grahami]